MIQSGICVRHLLEAISTWLTESLSLGFVGIPRMGNEASYLNVDTIRAKEDTIYAFLFVNIVPCYLHIV